MMPNLIATTARLRLVSSSPILAEAELKQRDRFFELLQVDPPQQWPPDLNDDNTIKFFLEKLLQGEDQTGWWCWYFIKDRELIGNGGFKGKPSKSGTVEIGYSILEQHRGRGYATEAIQGLLNWAFQHREVRRIVAETSSELMTSIRVLEKCGFIYIGEGTDAGAIRLGILRRDYQNKP